MNNLYIEIGQGSIQLLHGGEGIELSLEREPDGRLTTACRERVTLGLGDFLKTRNWRPADRAYCAIGARGVSLRRLSLPAVSRDDFQRSLVLRMEAEFPLPPDQLAWGSLRLEDAERPANGAGANHETFVAAVRKESLEEYADLLAGVGIHPVFTLAALARNQLCSHPAGAHALLEIGREHSELALFEHGVPVAIRILPWGSDRIVQAIAAELRLTPDEAEKLKLKLDADAIPEGELGRSLLRALQTAQEQLTASLSDAVNGQKQLFLAGRSARCREFGPKLARLLGHGIECIPIEPTPGSGCTAATLGLQRSTERTGGTPSFVFKLADSRVPVASAGRASMKWVAVAALLALGCLALPYLQALVLKPVLTRKLASMKTDLARTNVIDQELNFLRYLKQAQPPYSDALMVLADAGGARLSSLTMNRAGQVSFRASMPAAQQVTDFRSKLISSGFFASVSVDEQTPGQNQQGVNVRMSAQWKPPGLRPDSSKFDPSQKDLEAARASSRGGGMNMGMPMGMPVMMDMPGGMEIAPGARGARGARGTRGALGGPDSTTIAP